MEQEVIEVNREGESWLYLNVFFNCEKSIVNKLIALNSSQNIKKIKDFQTALEKTEQTEDIILSDMQRQAIQAVNDNNVCIITGGPRHSERPQQ
jgi:ATP-dependent exoDNAse (exonuclease V) alpha subunit